MTPVINPLWFWLMDFSDQADFAFAIGCMVCIGIYALIKLCAENEPYHTNKFLVIGIITFTISCVTPSADTIMKMLIANTITYENIESTKDSTKELVDYIIEKVDAMYKNEEEEK